ncbi:MAG: AraC family ligand binding domain-containing protein [Deltaproteobacteria bacterium]|nr:AraC family ligand binding domain-containing protein [Deltaproteobacteria bacterium]MBW1919889.1 AraC family ligand binding domain-containing protein [Deltaproteobacteria bacterium]MBW1934221.1 AraC family ligand binding domain-containing protein [Deltaproteobacteria bacterium]MBW1976480.1 AraC family ligand binding domain-containing protein [Deltaproteobacteria bacterium]MBW2044239.1 AraC family ligand binding domain-containing protein [Deltaproteobacteria bacterium]
MAEKKYVFPIDEVAEKITHGGSVRCKIVLDEESCGITRFSFLVNTMKAGLNCNQTGLGHSHEEEHCMHVLSGTGGISINEKPYNLKPGDTVYVPPGEMHYVWADPLEDFTYIIIYSPPGPEKNL